MLEPIFFLNVVSQTLKIGIVIMPLLLLLKYKIIPVCSTEKAVGFSVILYFALTFSFSLFFGKDFGYILSGANNVAILINVTLCTILLKKDFTNKKLLIKEDVDTLKEQIGKEGFTNLMYYSCTGVVEESKLDELATVMGTPEALNAQALNGNTALIYAVAHGNIDITHSLLESGADVSIKNSKGNDAMFFANKNNNNIIVSLLKKYRK
jgi:hypothetical protein